MYAVGAEKIEAFKIYFYKKTGYIRIYLYSK